VASERTFGPVNPGGGLDGTSSIAGGTTDHKGRLLQQSRLVPETGTLGAAAPSLRQRLFYARTAASFVLGLAILYLVYRRGFGLEWGEVWSHVASADGALLLLAFAVFYCSFPIRALRWRALLGNVGYGLAAGVPVPSTTGLTRIMYLGWFANCVTIARLGDAYRAYLLKKAAGVSFAVTLGTILAERLLAVVVLAAMLGATVLLAFRGTLPPEATVALFAGLILSTIGVSGVLVMRRLRGVVERVLPLRLHAHYERFEQGVAGSFKRVPLLVAYSAAGWIVEGSALYLTAAVDAPVSVAAALMVALVASLLTTVPFAPSGLGFTEAGTVLLLTWLGQDTDAAGAVALLSRIINYWSIVALGSVLYVFARNGRSPRLHPHQPVADHGQPVGLNYPVELREMPSDPKKEP
jgi:uncharacterized protein (TIRG00374 family)